MEEVKIEKKLKKQTENLYAADKEEDYPFESGHHLSVVLPVMEMDPLVVTNRSPSQLLHLMTKV